MVLSWLCYGYYVFPGVRNTSFIPNAFISYRVFPVIIFFILNDFVLLAGLKKNLPIIMLIWLVIGGINRVVRIQGRRTHYDTNYRKANLLEN